MIEPTSEDIGRGVIYRDHEGRAEQGAISSFNDNYVFVRFGTFGNSAAAVRREDLEWMTP